MHYALMPFLSLDPKPSCLTLKTKVVMVGRDGFDLTSKCASPHFLADEVPWPRFGGLGCLAGMTCMIAVHDDMMSSTRVWKGWPHWVTQVPNITKQCLKMCQGVFRSNESHTWDRTWCSQVGYQRRHSWKLGTSITRRVLRHVTRATHHWKACDERMSEMPRHGSNNEVEWKL